MESVKLSVPLLLQIVNTMSYADGYLSGIGKPDVYISEQTNCIVTDIMRLFEEQDKASPSADCEEKDGK